MTSPDQAVDETVEIGAIPMSITRRTAIEVLDRDFLETRGKVLEIAAALDRLDSAPSRTGEHPDKRLAQLRQALEALNEPGPGRAETIQHIFSDPYEADWRRS